MLLADWLRISKYTCLHFKVGKTWTVIWLLCYHWCKFSASRLNSVTAAQMFFTCSIMKINFRSQFSHDPSLLLSSLFITKMRPTQPFILICGMAIMTHTYVTIRRHWDTLGWTNYHGILLYRIFRIHNHDKIVHVIVMIMSVISITMTILTIRNDDIIKD